MAKVRWLLELFHIANIDADYLRRFNDTGVIWYTYYQWFFITTYLTPISEHRKTTNTFYLGKINRFPIMSRDTVFLYHILWFNIVSLQRNMYDIPLYNYYLYHIWLALFLGKLQLILAQWSRQMLIVLKCWYSWLFTNTLSLFRLLILMHFELFAMFAVHLKIVYLTLPYLTFTLTFTLTLIPLHPYLYLILPYLLYLSIK